MSKVTLLAIGAKYIHSSLAVWYLSEAVAQFSRFKHEVTVIEATINQPESEILAQIIASKPEVLGISTYIWNAQKLEGLLDSLKTGLPEVKVVLGGPEASYNSEYWLSRGADYVIHGEGEHNFPLLLDSLADGISVFTPSKEQENPIIDPYTDAYFNALNGRIAYLETSRGCPFRCAFCLSGGSHLRFFSLETAKKQLLRLSQSGARTIKLVDRTFNCNADRAFELFEYVIGIDTPCCFHFEIAADLFDERILKLLRSAPPGRIQLEAGLQSFHQPTLDAVSRKTSPEKAEQNLKSLLSGQNIHIHIDLIAGLPLETLSKFKQGFDRAYALCAHNLQLGFLKLLHGSALRAQAEIWGIRYSSAPPYEVLSTPWLSAEDLDVIRQTESALQRTYNNGRFILTLQYVLSVTEISPFDLFNMLGSNMSGHGVQLDSYAEHLFSCLNGLSGVDIDILRDNMVCDWLCSVKGKNMPDVLRLRDSSVKRVAAYAESFLGRKIARCEAAVLRSGEGVFVDSEKVNAVTGRYELHRVGGCSAA